MLIAVFCLFVMLTFLDQALRKGRLEILILSTRKDLFALRNFLRYSAIRGDIEVYNWIFDYLDTTLTKTASALPTLHAYEVVALLITARQREDLRREYNKIQAELQKNENSRYRVVFDGYEACLKQFFRQRHKIAYPLMKFGFSWIRRYDQFLKIKQEGMHALAGDSEVSTLKQYSYR